MKLHNGRKMNDDDSNPGFCHDCIKEPERTIKELECQEV